MTQPYIGQIQPFAFNFAPKNWAMCNGQIMAVQQNAALFSLLGIMYGGNGTTTFALPDLRSRVPMHAGTFVGNSYVQGQSAGAENVSLTSATTPMHNHMMMGTTSPGTSALPADGNIFATSTGGTGTPDNFYGPPPTTMALNPTAVGLTGGNQPHSNIQPYLAINWCISLAGVFPSRG